MKWKMKTNVTGNVDLVDLWHCYDRRFKSSKVCISPSIQICEYLSRAQSCLVTDQMFNLMTETIDISSADLDNKALGTVVYWMVSVEASSPVPDNEEQVGYLFDFLNSSNTDKHTQTVNFLCAAYVHLVLCVLRGIYARRCHPCAQWRCDLVFGWSHNSQL